jgi:hypothetical protein
VRKRVWKNRNPWNKKVWRNFRKWQVRLFYGLLGASLLAGGLVVVTVPIALSLLEIVLKWAIFYDVLFFSLIILLIFAISRFSNGNNHSMNNNGVHP